jgi:hypothetical protein
MKIGLPTKPQPGIAVNWAHPLAQGLVLCYIYNEGGQLVTGASAGSNPHNLAISTFDTCPGGDCQLANAAWKYTPAGLGPVSPVAGNGGWAPMGIGDGSIKAGSDWSMMHQQTIDAAGFNFWLLNFDNFGNSNNVGFALTATNTVALFSGAGGARNVQLQTAVTLATDKTPHICVGTRKAGTNLSIYIDGVLSATGGDGTFFDTTGFKWLNEISISSGPAGTVILDYIWNRTISAEEVAILNADPYVFFSPISPMAKLWYPFIATPLSATAADTLTLTDSVVAQLLAPINIAIFDSFSLSDAIANPGAGVTRSATDFLSFTDAVKLLSNLQLQVGDNITLSDLVKIQMTLSGVSVADVLTLTDSIVVQVAAVINVSVSDTLSFSDAVAILQSTTFNSYIRRYLNDVQ